ncbi:MAG: septum site-determining protein MinC [Methylicorpusculum sp.]|uniref:septum site-determining protein MinC n=1 Tax=Methylicorpusculum sp. TaxID=2713644 RepID=UPI0027202E54|nr:septum site-determining protein MinC [Methylicorpusculum sp.]MDO8842982.1 septum site-determining protein MinC [Methylicorpusculum sp.]MDO8940174.1 septum site-determining protein MinC [Methylicorpusculum sp.]MDP2202211.1 septum site-determining protein MinC [Methylicorpusculum sp.]
MSKESQIHPYHRPDLEFKSSSLSVPVLVLGTNDLSVIEQQLLLKIKQAPDFFRYSPLIIDLQELNKLDLNLDLTDVIAQLRKQDLLPIGIRGGTQEQNQAALKLGIPKMSAQSATASPQAKPVQKLPLEPEPEPEPVKNEAEATVTRVITQPVRSGQRIYSHGDLIVLAQVSAGAEIMAEGNIHVYNTLRGRALAGVQGDTEARIFCSDLQAELISIAGNYKISEDLDSSVRNKPVQIYLNELALIIKAL